MAAILEMRGSYTIGSGTAVISIYQNGVAAGYGGSSNAQETATLSLVAPVSCIVKANAGDTLGVYSYTTGGSATYGGSVSGSSFSIARTGRGN